MAVGEIDELNNDTAQISRYAMVPKHSALFNKCMLLLMLYVRLRSTVFD